MERMLVIGASGLVGGRIVEMARDKFEVYGTYNTHSLEDKNSLRLNCVDRKETHDLIGKIKPDIVIDTHALNNVDYCETHKEEAWEVNVDGSRNVAEACKNFGCKYVFLSTDYVFDGKKMKYSEKDKPRPLSYLAMNKLVVEEMLYALDINHIVARTSVVYGSGGLNKTNFVLWLKKKLENHENVSIVTDQKNNPTFSDSIVKQIMKLYDLNQVGIFHISGNECINRYEFALRIAETFGLDSSLILPITTAELHQVAPRPSVVNMSTQKVEKATGIATLSVGEGLSLYKDQLLRN